MTVILIEAYCNVCRVLLKVDYDLKTGKAGLWVLATPVMGKFVHSKDGVVTGEEFGYQEEFMLICPRGHICLGTTKQPRRWVQRDETWYRLLPSKAKAQRAKKSRMAAARSPK